MAKAPLQELGSLWLPEDFYDGPPRRILVCGSRTWRDRTIIRDRLQAFVPAEPNADEPTIVHGGARGADKIAGDVAMWLGLWVEEHPANWRKHGKAAGPIRNRVMLDTEPDLVLAFQWGTSSPGTQDTVAEAKRRGIRTEVIHRCGSSCWQVGGETGCIYLPEADSA